VASFAEVPPPRKEISRQADIGVNGWTTAADGRRQNVMPPLPIIGGA